MYAKWHIKSHSWKNVCDDANFVFRCHVLTNFIPCNTYHSMTPTVEKKFFFNRCIYLFFVLPFYRTRIYDLRFPSFDSTHEQTISLVMKRTHQCHRFLPTFGIEFFFTYVIRSRGYWHDILTTIQKKLTVQTVTIDSPRCSGVSSVRSKYILKT